MRWLLLQSCQCALPYHFIASVGYFTCAPRDYVVFRVRFPIPNDLPNNLTVLTADLSRFLTSKERSAQITINAGGYFVSPGPCGLTVPALDSPHCFSDLLDIKETPTQSIMSTAHQNKMTTAPMTTTVSTTTATETPTAMNTAPTAKTEDPATKTTTLVATTTAPATMTATTNANYDGGVQPVVVAQDNSAAIAVVAVMCGVTLILALGACTLVLIMFVKVRKM